VQLDGAGGLRARIRPEAHRQRRGLHQRRAHDACGVSQAVQEADLQQRNRGLLGAHVVLELGAQGGQEARIEQHPGVAHQHRLGVEAERLGHVSLR